MKYKADIQVIGKNYVLS